MLPDSYSLPTKPHSKLSLGLARWLADRGLPREVPERGTRGTGRVGLKRNFIVRGTDSSRKPLLATPAQCALFVPGRS